MEGVVEGVVPGLAPFELDPELPGRPHALEEIVHVTLEVGVQELNHDRSRAFADADDRNVRRLDQRDAQTGELLAQGKCGQVAGGAPRR